MFKTFARVAVRARVPPRELKSFQLAVGLYETVVDRRPAPPNHCHPFGYLGGTRFPSSGASSVGRFLPDREKGACRALGRGAAPRGRAEFAETAAALLLPAKSQRSVAIVYGWRLRVSRRRLVGLWNQCARAVPSFCFPRKHAPAVIDRKKATRGARADVQGSFPSRSI